MIYQINQILGADQGSFVVYTLPNPLSNFKSISVLTDDLESSSPNAMIGRQFSWSHDGVSYSNYLDLTNQNISALEQTESLYLKFKYTKLNSDPASVTINSLQLDFDAYEADPDDCTPVSEVVTDYLGVEIVECENDDAMTMSQQGSDLEAMLNYLVNSRNGVDVEYFRTEPESGNQDVFLNEYSLHNVVERKGIKIIIPDNEIPESQPNYTEWDIMFQEFQIHIDKAYWEKQFPASTPRVEDFIHFVHFGKLYRVSSTYLNRGTMDRSTYWVLDLKVADDNTAVDKPDEVREYIDDISISQDELFRGLQEEEEQDITNPQQSIRHNISNDDDNREYINDDVTITDDCLVNNGTVISDNSYDFSNVFMNNDKARIGVGGLPQNDALGLNGNMGVVYKNSILFCKGEDISFTYWMKPLDDGIEYVGFDITDVERQDRFRSLVTISKDIASSMVQKGGYITNGFRVYLVEDIRPDGKLLLLSKESIIKGSYKSTTTIHMPSMMSEGSGIGMSLVDYRYIMVRLDSNVYRMDMMGADLKNKWIGFITNLSTKFNYIEIALYELVNRSGYPDKYSTILNQVKKSNITIDTTDFTEFNNKPYIELSKSQITNLRIWKQAVADEHHNMVLNSKTVPNSSMAHLIDNARPLFNLLNLGEGSHHK